MAIKQISIEGNTLRVELDEFDAKILSRAWIATKPLMHLYILVTVELILSLASMEKEQRTACVERLRRGDPADKVLVEAGVDIENFRRKVNKIEWPDDDDLLQSFNGD